ncbi:MAG: TrkA family potassium uptake protein [Clostridiaceae bacterium]
MRSIIIGGGKVGYYLFKTLHERGHEVVLIERDRDTCQRMAEDISADVILGDGTDIDVLKDAGIENAEIVAAVTGTDEENLVICKIAKLRFDINRTIARVNNPKNMEMFKTLGIDTTVCSTAVIVNLIESEVNQKEIRIINTFERGSMVFAEALINEKMVWTNKKVAELSLPEECIFVSVLRGNTSIYPKGDTLILTGDKILLVTSTKTLSGLSEVLYDRGNHKWSSTKMK